MLTPGDIAPTIYLLGQTGFPFNRYAVRDRLRDEQLSRPQLPRPLLTASAS